ncbi:MAG: cbb3-type cytochrome oxidase assembly protein CcoS [Gammaproteobacteria bacterium]|nr:MAG: cbb3-type cytochrome oxidase assembly protein CcoS [Gammaproteobacteria bacterium]
MESLYFLVPCALIFIAIAVKVLFWAINNGQYDNLDTEAHRILFDDEKKKSSNLESHVQDPAEKSHPESLQAHSNLEHKSEQK